MFYYAHCSFFYQLLLSCLNSKIALSKRNLFFSRIAILSNKITCMSGKHVILYRSFCPTTYLNHFRDAAKMVRWLYFRSLTRIYRSFNCLMKIFPAIISKKSHQIPCILKFNSFFLYYLYNFIKSIFHCIYCFLIHIPKLLYPIMELLKCSNSNTLNFHTPFYIPFFKLSKS